MKFRPENIKKFREERGWTRDALSRELKRKKVGATTRTITNWESGVTHPTAFDLEKLSDIFKKSIGLFFAPVHYQTGSVN
jgi:transcriptional regulator with XRE-family HTH domain